LFPQSESAFLCLDNPVSNEDRSPATETGNTSDYSQLNMASLDANVPYDSIQPTYSEVRWSTSVDANIIRQTKGMNFSGHPNSDIASGNYGTRN